MLRRFKLNTAKSDPLFARTNNRMDSADENSKKYEKLRGKGLFFCMKSRLFNEWSVLEEMSKIVYESKNFFNFLKCGEANQPNVLWLQLQYLQELFGRLSKKKLVS